MSYMRIHIVISLIIVTVKVWTNSDISATSSRKQLWSSVVVVTSDGETSTIEEESSEPENSDDKISDV